MNYATCCQKRRAIFREQIPRAIRIAVPIRDLILRKIIEEMYRQTLSFFFEKIKLAGIRYHFSRSPLNYSNIKIEHFNIDRDLAFHFIWIHTEKNCLFD